MASGRPLGFLFQLPAAQRLYGAGGPYRAQGGQAAGARGGKAYRLDQVEASKRAYMELLGFVSHDLKNPLASIISEGKVLEGGYLGPMNDTRGKIVSRWCGKPSFCWSWSESTWIWPAWSKRTSSPPQERRRLIGAGDSPGSGDHPTSAGRKRA